MKHKIETSIVIDASVEAVWAILADFSQYPTWSPTIKCFYEKPIVGQRTKVLLEQPGGTSIKMNPMILQLAVNKEVRWKGSLWFKGIFDGEHYFILEPLENGQTKLIQGEIFSGILVPFLKKMIDGDTHKGFHLFNDAIKRRVENNSSLVGART